MTRIDRHYSPLSEAAFRTRYFGTHTPVVMRGVFKGQPLSELRSERHALARLSGLKLVLWREYGHHVRSSGRFTGNFGRATTIDRYLSGSWKGGEHWICTEQPLPGEIADLFTVPSYCLHAGTRSI